MHENSGVEEKSAVNLRIRTSLKQQAKRLGVNMSQVLERTLEEEIRQLERQAWQDDNRKAIDAYNKRIEERGLALAEYRSF